MLIDKEYTIDCYPWKESVFGYNKVQLLSNAYRAKFLLFYRM